MKAQIVVLASRFPYPLTKGDRLRMYYQIKALSQHFEIHLICINEEWPTNESMEALQPYCKNVTTYILKTSSRRINIVRHLGSRIPLQVRYFYDRPIHEHIIEEIKFIEPDYVYVQLVRMAPYALNLGIKTPIGLDFMDSLVLNKLGEQYLSKGLLNIFKGREQRLVKAYEKDVIGHFQDYFAISQRDRDELPGQGKTKINILSNGVDHEYFKPISKELSQPNFDLVFCGNMSYRPNIAAAQYITQKLVPSLTHLRWLIAGADMDEAIKNITFSSVTIEGYQSDIRDIYSAGKIMIVPIFSGSGQQNKVLEAMSCGLPCITTTFVNNAIGAIPDHEILIANDKEGFIEHINCLISQPDLRKRMGAAGRSFIEREFSWETNTDILVQTISNAIT